MTSLSVIVPTPDGGSLPNLFASLQGQLRDGDEVIVVGDTHHGHDLTLVKNYVEACGFTWLEHDAGYMGWGHPQINFGMTQAKGDYLVFQDDDDVFAPDALLHIRRAARNAKPPRPLIFKFRIARSGGLVLPIGRELGMGKIGGHCLVVPNVPEKLGKWTDRYEGDWDFIEETLRLWEPLEPVWRPEVITNAR